MYLNSSRTGLASKFEVFRQNIELTEAQKNKIIGSHIHLRDNILQPLNYVNRTFLTGSYARNTMIRPPKDVDIFVVLNYGIYDITPNAILNSLKSVLKITYPSSMIRRDKPCIVLDFNHCTFELTPAVEETSYWGEKKFYIPHYSENSWMLVEDPKQSGERLSEANERLDGKLTPLIKMMKKCRDHNNLSLKSYQMEGLAINGLWSISNYRLGVEELLRIYGWNIGGYTNYQVKNMYDDDFARYCRDYLFGTDFPS